MIVKAKHTARGANPRFIVTNVPGDAQELYEQVDCQRGEAENRIKEQQLDLLANRTSCHRFLANPFRLLLSAAAYLLAHALRRTALAGTELAEARVGTIRLKLLKVAARVTRSVRRVVFHLASSYPYRSLFLQVFGGRSRESPRVADPGSGEDVPMRSGPGLGVRGLVWLVGAKSGVRRPQTPSVETIAYVPIEG